MMHSNLKLFKPPPTLGKHLRRHGKRIYWRSDRRVTSLMIKHEADTYLCEVPEAQMTWAIPSEL